MGSSMTLIVTFFTSSGIAFAADSAITQPSGRRLVRWPKQTKLLETTRVGLNGGVVGYFGLARVGPEPMDTWLRGTLDRWHGSPRVADLGTYLRDELSRAVPKSDRTCNASGFHIGAFESRGGYAVPVLQYLSNIGGLDLDTGAYGNFGEYGGGEHFPTHPSGEGPFQNVAPPKMRSDLRRFERAHGMPMWFRNGDLWFASRTWEAVGSAIEKLTTGPGFEVPDDLAKWEQLAETLVATSGRLYGLLTSRGAPTIEGPYITKSISWPTPPAAQPEQWPAAC